jgi:hypothetical protein
MLLEKLEGSLFSNQAGCQLFSLVLQPLLPPSTVLTVSSIDDVSTKGEGLCSAQFLGYVVWGCY